MVCKRLSYFSFPLLVFDLFCFAWLFCQALVPSPVPLDQILILMQFSILAWLNFIVIPSSAQTSLCHWGVNYSEAQWEWLGPVASGWGQDWTCSPCVLGFLAADTSTELQNTQLRVSWNHSVQTLHSTLSISVFYTSFHHNIFFCFVFFCFFFVHFTTLPPLICQGVWQINLNSAFILQIFHHHLFHISRLFSE